MIHNFYASTLRDAFQYTPTPEQEQAIGKLALFLDSSVERSTFLLKGYAGTGKTTLVAALVKTCIDLDMPFVLMAPTGRAAKVLSMYAGFDAATVHRTIYRQSSPEIGARFELGFNRMRNALFVVDEASMLSSDGDKQFGSGRVMDDMLKYVFGGAPGCKLLLLGDDAQLPPVGCDFSPALDRCVMEHFGEVSYVSMDDVVRQSAESGILFNATMLRCMIENELYEVPRFRMDFPDIEAINGGELMEKLQDAYDSGEREDTIVITRSNKRANRYNEGIRRYNLSAEEAIESGDMLMVVKNNYHYTERIENCPISFMANGDIAYLKRIRRFEDFYGFHFADAILSFGDYDDLEIECKILLDTISSEAPSLTQEQSRKLFDEVEKDYLDIKSKIKRFREIRENPHYNAVQVKFAYAVTCHKAQGGQWKRVFIDKCLFGDEPMTRDMLRWLYTAITRATEKVYLVNFDDRFFE